MIIVTIMMMMITLRNQNNNNSSTFHAVGLMPRLVLAQRQDHFSCVCHGYTDVPCSTGTSWHNEGSFFLLFSPSPTVEGASCMHQQGCTGCDAPCTATCIWGNPSLRLSFRTQQFGLICFDSILNTTNGMHVGRHMCHVGTSINT